MAPCILLKSRYEEIDSKITLDRLGELLRCSLVSLYIYFFKLSESNLLIEDMKGTFS